MPAPWLVGACSAALNSYTTPAASGPWMTVVIGIDVIANCLTPAESKGRYASSVALAETRPTVSAGM